MVALNEEINQPKFYQYPQTYNYKNESDVELDLTINMVSYKLIGFL